MTASQLRTCRFVEVSHLIDLLGRIFDIAGIADWFIADCIFLSNCQVLVPSVSDWSLPAVVLCSGALATSKGHTLASRENDPRALFDLANLNTFW